MKTTFKELVETVLMAVIIFFVLQRTIMGFVVEGSSMEPNLHTGQRLLVNKAVYFNTSVPFLTRTLPGLKQSGDVSYFFHPPQRGEVIVFHYPRDPRQIYIKRVIGLPGDTVQLRESRVYINGQLMEEPRSIPPTWTSYGPMTVPANHYFVLGDNRNGSSDSRTGWTVPYENIIGKAFLIYWRPADWGLVPNFDLPLARASQNS